MGSRSARLANYGAVGGILVVLLFMLAFTVVSSRQTDEQVEGVNQSDRISRAYDAMRNGVSQAENISLRNGLEADPQIEAKMTAIVRDMLVSLSEIQKNGTVEDRRFVQQLVNAYLPFVDDPRIYSPDAWGVFGSQLSNDLRTTLQQIADQRETDAKLSADAFRRFQDRRSTITIAVNVVALLLTLVFVLVMRYYGRQLLRAKVEADKANHAKSQFLSRMSHELRTPLNAILGFSQLLEMDALEGEQRVSVGYISRAGKHLLGLIDEVLDIARIEEGRLRLSLEPLEMSAVVREVFEILAPMAATHDVRLAEAPEAQPGLKAMGDLQRVKQVLMNLVTNAIKYNVVGGQVAIAVSKSDGTMLVEVTDTGTGIAPGRMKRLFHPFDRLDRDAVANDGTGLGLAVSKALVEAMGGSIGAESFIGAGSRFWFRLPLSADSLEVQQKLGSTRRKAATPDGNGDPGCGLRVLCIDDNRAHVELVAGILQHRPGLALVRASSGLEGIELARSVRPALIVLDLHLGDVSGESVLAELKADARTASIPVIVTSAEDYGHTGARLEAAGADYYLPKPLDVHRFDAAVGEVLALCAPSEGDVSHEAA